MKVASVAGVGLVASGTAAYLAYTLAGRDELAPYLHNRRRAAMGAGLLLTAVGVIEAPHRPSSWLALGIAGGLVTYAVRRQWLLGHRARVYRSAQPLPAGGRGWAVVLPDGFGVRLREAALDRVVVAGQWMLVHCGLARSVAVFQAPRVPVVATLPHPSGFWLDVGGARVDGVDGSPTLTPVPVTLCRVEDDAAPKRYYSYRDDHELPSSPRPRVPGARGVEDAMRFGVVREGRWAALDGGEASLHLSRWAAKVRGLVVERE